jgi:glutamate N-acetyltransferase / amino-acid N-acetyltransferase
METVVQFPMGFKGAALNCGVKSVESTKLDLALVVSDIPCAAAGVFTTNLVCGAPVKVSRSRLPQGQARAVVLNSGNSNACTGERGIDDAKQMTALVAAELGCGSNDVLVCSTGVIGRFLPMDRIAPAIPEVVQQLAETTDALGLVANAMMTTDTVPKLSMRQLVLHGQTVTVTGVCKGAAMIAPNMATMLCVIMTDAKLLPAECHAMLPLAVNDSFNCISVDGHESTSDSVILLANGASGAGIDSPADRMELQAALNEVAGELAQKIIHDAEGADHFIQIDVYGARDRLEAFRVAKSIAESPLVKTAITGADPNWGRIVSAVGYAGVSLKEEEISLKVNGHLLYEKGAPVDFDAAVVSATIRDNREVSVELYLEVGSQHLRFWTADLTKMYVELNADYTT